MMGLHRPSLTLVGGLPMLQLLILILLPFTAWSKRASRSTVGSMDNSQSLTTPPSRGRNRHPTRKRSLPATVQDGEWAGGREQRPAIMPVPCEWQLRWELVTTCLPEHHLFIHHPGQTVRSAAATSACLHCNSLFTKSVSPLLQVFTCPLVFNDDASPG